MTVKKVLAAAVFVAISAALALAEENLNAASVLRQSGFYEQADTVFAPGLSEPRNPPPAELTEEESKALSRVEKLLGQGGAISCLEKSFMAKWFPRFLAEGRIGRAPSSYEKSRIQSWFPNIAQNDWWRITGEATGAYNCIAWSVGVTTSWLWPGSTQEIFDKFYLSYGYVPLETGMDVENAEIAYWEHPGGESTHGCRRVSGDVWESKLGSSVRLFHALKDLEGKNYGYVAKFYRKATERELVALGVVPKRLPAAGLALPTFDPSMTLRGAYDMGSFNSKAP